MVKPQARRAAVRLVQQAHGLSERRACRLLLIGRSSHRYEESPDRDGELRERIVELAAKWRRFGYRGLGRLLRRQGIAANHKRVYRVYREAGLQVRRRKRKRLKRAPRGAMVQPARRNEVWAMDFIHDGLVDGRRIRALTIVDLCTREVPWIEVATSIPGERVVRVLDQLAEVHGLPGRIVSDNGPEFLSVVMATWAEKHGVELDFIEPGQARAERLRRELQRHVPGRVPERALVHESAGREREDRGLEDALQRGATAQLSWRAHAHRVRGETCSVGGPKKGGTSTSVKTSEPPRV